MLAWLSGMFSPPKSASEHLECAYSKAWTDEEIAVALQVWVDTPGGFLAAGMAGAAKAAGAFVAKWAAVGPYFTPHDLLGPNKATARIALLNYHGEGLPL
jgi:hypothetical protein